MRSQQHPVHSAGPERSVQEIREMSFGFTFNKDGSHNNVYMNSSSKPLEPELPARGIKRAFESPDSRSKSAAEPKSVTPETKGDPAEEEEEHATLIPLQSETLNKEPSEERPSLLK